MEEIKRVEEQIEQLDQWYSRAQLPNFNVPWACANKECGKEFSPGDLAFLLMKRMPDKTITGTGYYCEECSKK